MSKSIKIRDKLKPPDKKSIDEQNVRTVRKCKLDHIINDISIKPRILDAVTRTNKIVIHTYQFMKLYLLYLIDRNKPLPTINEIFVKNCMHIISKKKDRRGSKISTNNKDSHRKLVKFFESHYRSTITDDDIVESTKINIPLQYAAVEIITNISNNISMNYINHIKRFVNVAYDIKDSIDEINESGLSCARKIEMQQVAETALNVKDSPVIIKIPKLSQVIKMDMRKIVNDLYRNVKDEIINITDTKLPIDPIFDSFINKHKPHIIPKKVFDKNSLYYDLKSNPLDYLSGMIYMDRFIEKCNLINSYEFKLFNPHPIIIPNDVPDVEPDIVPKGIIKVNSKNRHGRKSNKKPYIGPIRYKLFNALPERTKIIPKYITLDTTAIINLFFDKDAVMYRKNVHKSRKVIWDKFFKTNMKVFKRRNYRFNFMINTDGMACSIHFIREDQPDKTKFAKKVEGEVSVKRSKAKKVIEQYIDDLDHNELTKLNKYRKVGADPGKKNLFYSVDSYDNKFRYTANQRKMEIGTKKYKKILLDRKKANKLDDQSIEQIESKLSRHDHKSCLFDEYKEYLIEKHNVNRQLFGYYNADLFRKFNWNTYINTQRSESKMINNFKRIYGEPDKTMIIFGDWEQRKHMKYSEPTKGKGIRTLFKKAGYKLYLLDEFRTSCRCHKCFQKNEPYKKRKNKEGEIEPVRGLLHCKHCINDNDRKSKLLYGRDLNGSKNILTIGTKLINGESRPIEFRRGIDEKQIVLPHMNRELDLAIATQEILMLFNE
jgi:hypothetical protein